MAAMRCTIKLDGGCTRPAAHLLLIQHGGNSATFAYLRCCTHPVFGYDPLIKQIVPDADILTLTLPGASCYCHDSAPPRAATDPPLSMQMLAGMPDWDTWLAIQQEAVDAVRDMPKSTLAERQARLAAFLNELREQLDPVIHPGQQPTTPPDAQEQQQ